MKIRVHENKMSQMSPEPLCGTLVDVSTKNSDPARVRGLWGKTLCFYCHVELEAETQSV